MVAIACHSLALLTIAACAVTALGADEVEGGNQNVAAQVSETNEGQAVIPGRKGVNPVLAGAAVGSTLFLALLLFGLKVLGKKVVQTDSKTAGSKVAEVVFSGVDGFTLSTEAYTAWVEVIYEGKAKQALKKLQGSARESCLKNSGRSIQRFLQTIKSEGERSFLLQVGDEEIVLAFDLRVMQPLWKQGGANTSPNGDSILRHKFPCGW
uniref:Uncharacterized protein n=1 Tax=Eimeria tenella TaxID=5802 RepID=H9B9V8_EIMTE|nr:hypothetical protein [Eimeria tenella]